MNYSSFNVEDFVLEPSFRNYCLRINLEDRQYWETWIKNNPSRIDEINKARDLVLMMHGGLTEQELINDELRFKETLEKHLETTGEAITTHPGTFPLRRYMTLGAAMVVLIILVTMFYQDMNLEGSRQFKEYASSKTGETKSMLLPDGTSITLNAGSTIDLAADFNLHTRELQLSGEAYFDVAHNRDKPFVIHTPLMDVKVLGTSFNVKSYPEDRIAETTLIEGSVEVQLKHANEKVMLRPSEKITLSPKPTQKKESEKLQEQLYKVQSVRYDQTDSSIAEISWKASKLVFIDDRFEEMAKMLERLYNVHIRFMSDEVRDFRYTANFQNKDIRQVIEALRLSRPFKYVINNNEIIISGPM